MHGIKLLLPLHYYYLPKKTLSVQEVFLHSLCIAQKEKDARSYIYIALFYLKHRAVLEHIEHPVLQQIKAVLIGERVVGYPTLVEIQDRADVYDIRL